MEMSSKISLSSSLSSSSGCSGIGTDLCHPQTILQMSESRSKPPSESFPLITKIEDDGASNKVDDVTTGGNKENATTSDRNSANTIPVRTSTGSNSSNDQAVTIQTNAIERTEPIDDTTGKGNKNKKGIMNSSDAIANIAASSHFRSRRKKRERSDSTAPPQQISPPTSDHMPMISNPPAIVTASMSNHYVPPRLQIGIGSINNNSFARSKSNDKNFAGNSNGHKNKVSVHMLNSVGLECGDDGMLRLDRFDDDDDASICANDIDGVGPIKTEDETGEDRSTAFSKKQKLPMWTLEQHKAFSAAIFEIGLKNCSPSIIMENMRKQPKYITRERTKSHLQKYRQTKERSKGEFLKEFDAFFKSTEQAKDLLNSKNSNSSTFDNDKSIDTNKIFKRKEPVPKAILTTALEGKKPSKLLGGKAAALLSYSVLNDFSTNHGPDQLQYKAAKFSEFPSLTEDEKRSSVGASLLQVKSLIDNMTDALLKTRHGIKPFPVRKSGIGDDESVSSSLCSSEDGYSDEDEDNIEGGGAVDKHLVCKAGSKDQDLTAAAIAAPKYGMPFPMGAVPVGPAHPLYRGPSTAYPAPFPAPGAPPPVATVFPPPQYPHAQPSFYAGAPPHPHLQPAVAPTPGFGAPAGFHHPQMHYSQDPRINPYQQAPPTQVGSYPGVPPMQPNYYQTVTGYPPFYGSTSEGNIHPVASNASAEYIPHHNGPGDVYSNHSRHKTDEHRRRSSIYDQQSPSYQNDGRCDRRTYDMNESSAEKRSRRRPEKRSKHGRRRKDRGETPLSIDTSDVRRTGDNDFGDFLDRLSKIPTPSKSSKKSSSSSPIQRSRRQERFKASPPLNSEDSPVDKQTQSLQQQYQPQFETSAQSNSYAKNAASPDTDHFSEGGVASFASTYDEVSPVHRTTSERTQSQAHVDQHQHSSNNSQFWESSNYGENGYINQQQPQNAGEVAFHQQPAQLDAFGTGPAQQQQQNQRSYGGVDHQQVANPMFIKSEQSSPAVESTTNYFFGG